MFGVQNNIIGNRVRLARIKKTPRMTQDELANKLQLNGWDISRGGLAKIEAGIRKVYDYEAIKLAKALDVSASWLLGEDLEAPQRSKAKKRKRS